jgi:hypothetical protein
MPKKNEPYDQAQPELGFETRLGNAYRREKRFDQPTRSAKAGSFRLAAFFVARCRLSSSTGTAKCRRSATQNVCNPIVRRFVYEHKVVVAGWKGSGMRDWKADWQKWTPAERALAIAILMSMMAVPVGILLGITGPGV